MDPAVGPRRPRPIFLVVGLVLAFAVGVGLFATYSGPSPSGPPTVGSPVPSFSLPRMSGTPSATVGTKVSGHRGRIGLPEKGSKRALPVVVLFFASWCVPCHTEIPELAHAIASKKMNTGIFSEVTIVGVDGDSDQSAGNAFLAQSGVTFPVGNDGSLAVTQGTFGFFGDPAAAFVTESGIIEKLVSGSISAQVLRDDISRLVSTQ